MSVTNFKMNGIVKFTYDPGYKKVPEFGVYVLGEPTPSVQMLEELVICLEALIDSANGDVDEDEDDDDKAH